jgi:two-component system CheB/CheR fusion protein
VSDAGSQRDDGGGSRPECDLVVGVGASAGGLEALTALVTGITVDGFALVVVQHLPREHESLLPGILGRSSRMQVASIADGMRVEPNHVYVAPPEARVALLRGVFHLMPPAAPPWSMPIDFFFRSLAEDRGQRAIGVVLSGMGHDGTRGLEEIKARGGVVFAQDPGTAKYESMPKSAIDRGVVDRVLPPEQIARELMALSKHPYLARGAGPARLPGEPEDLGRLLILLRSEFGADLSLYKPSTIQRRVERRMAVHRIEGIPDYVRYVQEHHAELAELFRDVLIGVTGFFRDVEPFEVLERAVIPAMLERKRAGSSIRVWVPACASGEEAYSIAICLFEALDRSAKGYRIQIFGTDIDQEAIARARRGAYPASIEADVSPERLDRFFVRVGDAYHVQRRLRDVVVFSPQNVAQDAPFSRMDIVSCRNLLIYLQPALQKKVLRLLHYALVPDGTLLLGTSETVGDCAELFSLADRKNKIYVKKNLPTPVVPADETLMGAVQSTGPAPPVPTRRSGPTVRQLADRKLVERFGPPSVLVDENLDVVQFRGDTAPYVAPSPGVATLNLAKLLRPELQVEVWRAAQQAFRSDASARVGPIRLAREGESPHTVSVDLLLVHDPDTKSRCLLLVFEDRSETAPCAAPAASPAAGDEKAQTRIRELEEELSAAKEYLQSTIEELETSNEELRSLNEELQSTNEELQSTNEELETSKEELQSTNEELSTMNDELQHRNADLSRTGGDLDNLLTAMPEPVLFVDCDMCVRLASESARSLLALPPGPLERALGQIRSAFVGMDVEQAAQTSIARLVAVTEQARVGDRWYEVRAVPYRSPGGVIDGVMLLLRDIDAEKRRQDVMLDVEAYAAKVLAAVPQPLAIVDRQLRVLWVNEPFLSTFRVAPHATIGNLLQNLGSGQWAHPKLREAMERTLATGQPFHEFRIEHEFDVIGRRVMDVSGTTLSGIGGPDRVLLLSMSPRDGTSDSGGVP